MKNLIELTFDLESIYKNTDVADYFKDELDWVLERRELWQNSKQRVAFIGITSCGKSTLMNAILSRHILPKRVRPSSNSLVICKWGEKFQAIIHFKDGTYKDYLGDDVDKYLRIYADEEANPDNEYGVKEIELFSPEFKFDKNIEVVDTPGLDAHNYNSHEELTMQFLLPSVDSVVFITTAKANSDERIRLYLNVILKNKKPVIFVQNMIDSVEPKIGVGGVIELTKVEVAAKHLKRAQKLIDRLENSKSKIPILQTSAIWAQDKNASKSGIPELIKVVNSFTRNQTPSITKGRFEQLSTQIKQTIAREASRTNVLHKERINKDIDELKHIDSERLKHQQSVVIDVRKEKDAANKKIKKIKEELNRISSHDKAHVKSVVGLVDDVKNYIPFIELVRKFQSRHKALAAKLNLRLEDASITVPRAPRGHSIHLRVTEHSKTTRVRKSGAWNSVKRFVHLGGWEDKIETWTEMDLSQLKKDIKSELKLRSSWIKSSSKIVENEVEKNSEYLRKVIDKKQKSLNVKLHTETVSEKRQNVAKNLLILQSEIENSIQQIIYNEEKIKNTHSASFRESLKTINIPGYAKDLVLLADTVSRNGYIAVRDYFLDRSEKKYSGAKKQVVVIGFDSDCIDEFMDRYWFDYSYNIPDIKQPFVNSNSSEKSSVELGIYLDCLKHKNNSQLTSKFRSIFTKPTTIFVLVDAEQPGATASSLSRSIPIGMLNAKSNLYFVIQNLKGLENSNQLIGGLWELISISQVLGLEVDGFFANDANTTKSVMINYLTQHGQSITTIKDEEIAVKSIVAMGSEELEYVAKWVKKWREEVVSHREEQEGQ